MLILNLTNRDVTPAEVEVGVIEFHNYTIKEHIRWLNYFHELPSDEELLMRANHIRQLTEEWAAEYRVNGWGEITGVMLGGEHFMVRMLEKVFIMNGFKIFYPFNRQRVLQDSWERSKGAVVDARQFYGFVVTDQNKVESIFAKLNHQKCMRELMEINIDENSKGTD